MAGKGFLLVLMQPPPAFEEEFNAWYDTEHVPERLAVPGFETAKRYVCVDGAPHYLAMYDLASPDVLESPAYRRVSFDRSSPWTMRVVAKVRVQRAAGRQIHPGDALTGSTARVVLLRFRGLAPEAEDALVQGLQACFESRPAVRRLRVFADMTGPEPAHFGFVEARAPLTGGIDVTALGAFGDALDLVNTYAAY